MKVHNKNLRFAILILILIFTNSCKEKVNSQVVEKSNVEISEIFNDLLRFKFYYASLIQIETMPNHMHDNNEIPPPPGIISYVFDDFKSMIARNVIDSIEAEYMMNKINPENTIKLDTSLISISCISKNELDLIFENNGFDGAYKFIEKNYGSACFIKVSNPIFNKQRSKVLISVDHMCGPLNGLGYVILLAKKNLKWKISMEWITWES